MLQVTRIGRSLLLNCIMASGLVWAGALADEVLDPRLSEVDPLLRKLEETGRQYMNVPREHGRFLRMLVEMTGRKSALEIGTSNGYSAIWIGLGLEQTGGKLTTVEIAPQKVVEAKANTTEAGLAEIVTCVEGDALKVIPGLEDTYDFVFIDAVKSDYWQYYELLRPKLRPGAVIAAHNAISARNAMAKYFEIVEGDPNLRTTVVAIAPQDGMAITYVAAAMADEP